MKIRKSYCNDRKNTQQGRNQIQKKIIYVTVRAGQPEKLSEFTKEIWDFSANRSSVASSEAYELGKHKT